ncbi:hypothetical protein FD723_40805 (plasmid) [Nostoc sp. C052]|uniref:WDGH domain-containing protein n=1 Tax=Nostoc sp. C052 TaxID=2576902 RepID=UPI0015C3969C|nr:hypothetical protein [Nostoc sp. C052]QLE46556.1 hypothetical protein FD723_40805 [Nostoc sp. C052]
MFTAKVLEEMQGQGGFWVQGEAVYIPSEHAIASVEIYRNNLAKGKIGIISNLPTMDAYKAVSANEAKNLAYSERNKLLVPLCKMAIALNLVAGIGQHQGEEWDDDWRNIIFLELPTGQISFHIHDSELHLFQFLPPYTGKWDGHDTATKWDRLLDLDF